ncbi:MAG: hypothetical protein JWM80_2617, partial [Cyanobacteria bacterium RYN_339]|nr:hypothetical protein [Cyanobacteria bacterium RYN_339]
MADGASSRGSSVDESLNLPPGFRAPRYLAQGAFGRVYAATTEAGEPVAIKLLAADRLGQPDVVWRFTAEYRRLASLDHPAFPRAVDEGVDAAGRPFYAMALVAGLPPQGPLPASQVRTILAGAADGLLHLHGRGLVHGDLKPANMLWDAAGRVSLVDPGGMMPIGRRRATVEGTLEYLAPEGFRRADAAPEADWYALGVVGHQLWTGLLPFEGPPAALLKAHLQATPPALPGDDARLAGAIAALMTKDPAARARALPAALSALGLAPEAEPPRLHRHGWLLRPALLAAWDARPSVLLVEGGPGSGKSQALESLRLAAELEERPWVGAAATGVAGALLRGLARQWLGAAGLPTEDPLAAWLSGHVPAAWADLEPAGRRAALGLALGQVLARCPSLVVGVDDLDRADAGDRELLLRLAARDTKVTWCFTAASGLDVAARCELPLLTAAEVAALVALRLGQEAPPALLTALAASDQPGAIDELLVRWESAGALHAALDGTWHFDAARADVATLPILDALSPAAQALAYTAAQAAAVGSLDALVLGQAAEVAADDLGPALDALVAAGILAEDAGRYRLARPLPRRDEPARATRLAL